MSFLIRKRAVPFWGLDAVKYWRGQGIETGIKVRRGFGLRLPTTQRSSARPPALHKQMLNEHQENAGDQERTDKDTCGEANEQLPKHERFDSDGNPHYERYFQSVTHRHRCYAPSRGRRARSPSSGRTSRPWSRV